MNLESQKNNIGSFVLWMFGIREIKQLDPFVAEIPAEQTDLSRLHEDQNVMMRILLNETVRPASMQAIRDTAALQEVAASLKT